MDVSMADQTNTRKTCLPSPTAADNLRSQHQQLLVRSSDSIQALDQPRLVGFADTTVLVDFT